MTDMEFYLDNIAVISLLKSYLGTDESIAAFNWVQHR